MKLGNMVVSGLLRSPMHRLLSGSTCLIRYTGRRLGRQIITPTQYVQLGDDVIILVARHEAKTWWRNFHTDADIDVLLQHRWTQMTARAVTGADEPDTVAPLLDAYLQRYPKAAHALGGNTNESRETRTVVVYCRPRR
jgi:hypothetical protein